MGTRHRRKELLGRIAASATPRYDALVATASTRVLRLLSLLQTRNEWSGTELSERLEVDVRTIRRDAGRLRELGYAIDSSAGPGGGYRLAAGAHTPPLLLEDEEALTVAMALRAIAGSDASFADTALRTLVKLDQLLPTRLKRKWESLRHVTLSLVHQEQAIDINLLATLAAACRDERRITFKYGDRKHRESQREVEPMRLVHTGRVWYLAAWDTKREDWRTFRLDRIDFKSKPRLGMRFNPRKPPEDFATFVSRAIAAAPYRYQARLSVPLSATEARRRVPAWVGVVEPLSAHQCALTIGGNTPESIAALVINAGVDFELLEPAEIAEPIRKLGERLLRGVKKGRRSARAA